MNNEKSSSRRVVLHKLLIGIILILFVTLGIFLAGSVSAFAGKSGSLEESRRCVFGIKVFLTTDQGEQSYPIREATGFLVGDPTKDSSNGQHILASKSAMMVSAATIQEIRATKGVPKDQKLQPSYKLIVSKDLELNCTIMNESRDSDFVILTPEQNLADRSGIPVLKSLEIKDGTVLMENYYDGVNEAPASETFTWMADAKKDEKGNMLLGRQSSKKLGSPVLDASGNLVGMLAKSGKHTVLLPTMTMTSVMDSLGITYVDSQSHYAELGELLERGKEKTEDTKTYTQTSIEKYKQVLDNAKTVYEASDSKESDYQDQICLMKEGEKELRKKSDYIKYAVIALAVLILVLLLIAGLFSLLNARKRKKPSYYEDDKTRGNHMTRRQKRALEKQKRKKAGGRKVAGATPMELDDFERTVTVGSSTLPTAFLQSTTDGKQALINKAKFTLGKSRDYCEYVVEGNRTISRRHARITNENGVFFIEDLQSMNHTYLNDKQLADKERAVLRNGDHIKLANEELIFLMR